jgi:uncharacterized protein
MVQTQALEKLRNGEIAATVLVAGKPTLSMSRPKASDGLAFLPIPYDSQLGPDFIPAKLTHNDYPDLIPPGGSIDTIADGAVLISYNWPKNTERNRRVETFVNAFFPRIAEFYQPPHHVKWREVDLKDPLPGWARLDSAETWLLNNSGAKEIAEGRVPTDEHAQFKAYLNARDNSSSMRISNSDALFQEFLKWRLQTGH